LTPDNLVQQPGVLVVDIRPRWRYRLSHVVGSHSIPAGLLLEGEAPEGDLLLIGNDSQQAEAVIDQLHEQGYLRKVSYLKGGYSSWQAETQIDRQIEWEGLWNQGDEQIVGPAFFLLGAVTQSLGILALGLVLWLGPKALARSRA
jgi:rhodanese-related sulfurtransferase